MNIVAPFPAQDDSEERATSAAIVNDGAANELVFAVVGYVGSGNSVIAKQLESQLSDDRISGGAFDVTIVKVSDEIRRWAQEKGSQLPDREPKTIESSMKMQDLGNECRKTEREDAALARRSVYAIRKSRAEQQKQELVEGDPVIPDGTRRAWIIDSLRCPSEAELLRHLYQEAFLLIGAVCDEDKRKARLATSGQVVYEGGGLALGRPQAAGRS